MGLKAENSAGEEGERKCMAWVMFGMEERREEKARSIEGEVSSAWTEAKDSAKCGVTAPPPSFVSAVQAMWDERGEGGRRTAADLEDVHLLQLGYSEACAEEGVDDGRVGDDGCFLPAQI